MLCNVASDRFDVRWPHLDIEEVKVEQVTSVVTHDQGTVEVDVLMAS